MGSMYGIAHLELVCASIILKPNPTKINELINLKINYYLYLWEGWGKGKI